MTEIKFDKKELEELLRTVNALLYNDDSNNYRNEISLIENRLELAVKRGIITVEGKLKEKVIIHYKTKEYPKKIKKEYGQIIETQRLTYELLGMENFCEAFLQGEDEGYIVFNDEGSPEMYIQDYVFDSIEYYRIDFCPFCGKEIELVEKERIKMVEKKRKVEREETYYEEVKE